LGGGLHVQLFLMIRDVDALSWIQNCVTSQYQSRCLLV